ncbi:hypothetical protein ACQP04_14215 [Pseudonocardia halophobica]|uniref:hypothetical protein n=1 Tax=Pseudonocardia halophobica TaxID=29401 RepID=UPI003D8B3DB9
MIARTGQYGAAVVNSDETGRPGDTFWAGSATTGVNTEQSDFSSGVEASMTAILPDRPAAPYVAMRAPATPASARVAGVVDTACRCGHGSTAHEHYRRGTECVTCDCPRFRRAAGIRLFRR